MSGLPATWVKSTLAEVADIITGGTPPTSRQELYGGSLPFAKPPYLVDGRIAETEQTISEEGRAFTRVVPCGSTLISCIGNLGKTGLTVGDTAFNQQLNAAVFSDAVHPLFGFYQSQTLRAYLEEVASATTISIVNKSKLSTAPFVVAPYQEQVRIVAKIEELFSDLDAGVAALERVRIALRRYRASVLRAAVEGRLTERWRDENPYVEPADELLRRILDERRKRWEEEQLAKYEAKGKKPPTGWREKYKEPERPDIAGLPELPDRWCWTTVQSVASHRLGKMLDKAKNVGIVQPYLRNVNVRWFKFDLSDVAEMRVTAEEFQEVSVQSGDLVVCEGGEPGRCAVWPSGSPPIAIQKALHRVRTYQGVLAPYLALVLAADAQTGRLAGFFTGSTILHFTGEALRSYVIPLPPADEQSRIVDEAEALLGVCDAVAAQVADNQLRTRAVRQGILTRAFDGHLVPQDPTDEPASALLDCINAERDQAQQTTKAGRSPARQPTAPKGYTLLPLPLDKTE